MIDAERFKLLYGPYIAPQVRCGETLFCELRGEVVVTDMWEGCIAWPMSQGKRGRPAFILCSDLLKAQRRLKFATARKGNPRPRHVIEAMRAGRLSKPQSEATRRTIGKGVWRSGIRPPAAVRAWMVEEESLLGKLPNKEVARRTGRTLVADWSRRRKLGILNRRSRKTKRKSSR